MKNECPFFPYCFFLHQDRPCYFKGINSRVGIILLTFHVRTEKKPFTPNLTYLNLLKIIRKGCDLATTVYYFRHVYFARKYNLVRTCTNKQERKIDDMKNECPFFPYCFFLHQDRPCYFKGINIRVGIILLKVALNTIHQSNHFRGRG
jgi:hypothetical protein